MVCRRSARSSRRWHGVVYRPKTQETDIGMQKWKKEQTILQKTILVLSVTVCRTLQKISYPQKLCVKNSLSLNCEAGQHLCRWETTTVRSQRPNSGRAHYTPLQYLRTFREVLGKYSLPKSI
jgi:hypothetical protein